MLRLIYPLFNDLTITRSYPVNKLGAEVKSEKVGCERVE